MRLRWTLPFTIVRAVVAVAGCASEAPPSAERGGGDAPVVVGPSSRDPGPPPVDGGVAQPSSEAEAGAGGPLAPFHLIGRVDRRDPAGPRFGWPGTEIRARIEGTGLSLRLADTGTSHYDVSIDGMSPALLVVSGPEQTYEVASGLAPGVHDVVVTKRTETVVGVTQLLGIEPAPGGRLVPTPSWTGRRIEIVGDSISCGYGVLGIGPACQFTPATESEPLAWGALASRSLSAMHTSVAFSGLGVWRNYGGDPSDTMPARYSRALANDPSSLWDHSFVPDVVVVNLGTNDFTGGQGDPGPSFESAYAAFLGELRAVHPSAPIVAVTSPMLSEPNRTILRGYVEDAIAARAAAGDTNVTLLDIEEQHETDGYGCDYHPSAAKQQAMAAALTAHLWAVMRW